MSRVADYDPSNKNNNHFWDNVYGRELDNFVDHGDVGEIWFSEASIDRVVKWLNKCEAVTKESRVIDLGCGNGMTLIALGEADYVNLTGVDYSLPGIELAQKISDEKQLPIKYYQADLLDDSAHQRAPLTTRYDVCLDKGTYDAISLSPHVPQLKCRESYARCVQEIVKSGGMFILTSCNWTEEELKEHFTQDFRYHSSIPTPKFQFGGKTGTREACVVFQRC